MNKGYALKRTRQLKLAVYGLKLKNHPKAAIN
jgi:hypothetical protein